MEQEFYRDEFEQLLKDTTDDFKMYPSRKVWHSIYNDLHPDRKWPSFAVCLLLLTTILYVGVTNNNAISNKSKRNTAFNENYNQPAGENTAPPAGKYMAVASSNTLPQNDIIDLSLDINFASQPQPHGTEFPVLSEWDNTVTDPAESTGNNTSGNDYDAAVTAKLQEKTTHNSFENSNSFTASANTKLSVTPSAAVTDETAGLNKTTADDPETTNAAGDDETAAEKQADAKKELSALLAANKNITKDTRELEWVEDFAFYNKSNAGKNLFKGLSTQFYVTPSIGYRVMFRNNNYKGDDALVVNNAARNSVEKVELNQQATINMEAGMSIIKDLNKRLRFKTGLQFNYTDYLTYAQKLDHPTQTTMVVNGQGTGISMEAYSSDYAHIPGKNTSKLHNNTIQLSIPLGMDYKLLSNRVLNWYVGATVQPTLVTRSHSYLLSSDNNYFVQNQDMFRRWNLNGAIESFVSFKTPSGTFINIGPQFRYQLFSSYSKAYTYTEKPYSVGFKIGFTRPL